jgi:hypothetical protein
MTRSTILALATLVLAAAVSTTALAASTAKDPKAMVLQKADLPSGAVLHRKIPDKSPQVNTYSVEWRYKAGGKRYFVVSVASVMSRKLAVASFDQVGALFRDGYRVIKLPRYGDEQVAGVAREDNAGELWVRTGAVVWSLTVNTFGLESGHLTKDASTALLMRFAQKQKLRVRSG